MSNSKIILFCIDFSENEKRNEGVETNKYENLENLTNKYEHLAQRVPKGSQKGAKVCQKGAKGSQKGAKGSQREPKGSQKGAKGEPKDDQNAQANLCPKKGAKKERPWRWKSLKFIGKTMVFDDLEGAVLELILDPFWTHFQNPRLPKHPFSRVCYRRVPADTLTQ